MNTSNPQRADGRWPGRRSRPTSTPSAIECVVSSGTARCVYLGGMTLAVPGATGRSGEHEDVLQNDGEVLGRLDGTVAYA
jgi:hypothetical protein